ncbi:MAG: hypothetical protein ABW046_18595 [Actinoplanes sp.]
MRSLVYRRTARAMGAATVAVIALAGCSAGQVAETAILKTPISGLNTESPDGGLQIRNLQVVYNSPTGYPAGSSAPLQVSLFNQTEQAITVLISSAPQGDYVSAEQVGLVGAGAAAAPSGEPSAPALPDPSASAAAPAAPARPAAQPARFTIKPHGSETFLPGGDQSLQVIGLSDVLRPGSALNLVFEVSTSSQPLTVQAPFEMPLSPASRAPGETEENHEE